MNHRLLRQFIYELKILPIAFIVNKNSLILGMVKIAQNTNGFLSLPLINMDRTRLNSEKFYCH
jgi:hypothetical protein